jgi:DNA repair protein RecO (recombination protein O)
MQYRRYSSEAIVLSRKNFSEADRILTVFSKHYGKLSVIAKGVRKPKSRKRGALEVFSLFKFSAAKGKNLDIVTEAELIDSFKKIRKSLKKTSVAYFLVEVVNRLTREDEKNFELYTFLVDSLDKLKESRSPRKLRENFIYQTLVMLGFWPKGKKMVNPDFVLEEIIEREMSSKRVGKKILM